MAEHNITRASLLWRLLGVSIVAVMWYAESYGAAVVLTVVLLTVYACLSTLETRRGAANGAATIAMVVIAVIMPIIGLFLVAAAVILLLRYTGIIR